MENDLNIDEMLLLEAQKLGAHRTMSETINRALAGYISKLKRKQVLNLFDKVDLDPDYDHKKGRKR